MIKSPLAFFQMQVEGLFVNAFQSMDRTLAKLQNASDAIDV